MKIVLRIAKVVGMALAAALVLVILFLTVGRTKAMQPEWGVNFSEKLIGDLGLSPREVYAAILDDLGAKRVKLATYWDILEPTDNNFDFNNLDEQFAQAEKHNAEIILVVGMKTPRWP